MIIPYQFDVPMYRWPVVNFGILIVTILVSLAAFGQQDSLGGSFGPYEPLVLDGWSPVGIFGSALLHGDMVHLVGNMVFLWVFGNAVCSKMGNGLYLAAYVTLAGAASVTHLLLDGHPAIGASGAINGVIGLALVWYPANTVSCFWWFFYRGGRFEIDCRFLVVIWLGFDIFGVVIGAGMTAYWAHLGGLAAGVALATLLLKHRWVEMDAETELSIFDLYGGGGRQEKEQEQAARRRRRAQGGAVIGLPGYDFPKGDAPPTEASTAPWQEAADAPPASGTAVAGERERPAADSGPSGPLEAIKVRCRCGAKFRVASAHVGKKGRCPKCRQPVRIKPAPS